MQCDDFTKRRAEAARSAKSSHWCDDISGLGWHVTKHSHTLQHWVLQDMFSATRPALSLMTASICLVLD